MRDARRLLPAAFAVVGLVVAVLLLWGAHRRTDVVQSNGVVPVRGVARLTEPGQLVCEEGLPPAEDFSVVRVFGTGVGRATPPLRITVRDAATKRPLATGDVAPRREGLAPFDARLSAAVPDDRLVDVCIAVRRRGAFDAYGSAPDPGRSQFETETPVQQTLTFRGTGALPGDFRLELLRERRRSLLARVPSALRRATTFKPAPVAPWTLALAVLLALLVAPVVLSGAVGRAAREDDDEVGV